MASIRVDELILPVEQVRLVRGGLEITVRVSGPCPASSGYIRLFDDKGEPVTELAEGTPSWLDIPSVREQDTLAVTYCLWFEHIQRKYPPVYEVRCG